jgi:hypothetical protein
MIKLRRMKWAGHVACMGEMRKAYKIFICKPEDRKPFIRSRCRQEDNIKMDLRVEGCGMESSDSGQ